MVLYVIAFGAFSWLLTQTKNQINKKFSSSKSSKLTQLIQNLSVKMFMFLWFKCVTECKLTNKKVSSFFIIVKTQKWKTTEWIFLCTKLKVIFNQAVSIVIDFNQISPKLCSGTKLKFDRNYIFKDNYYLVKPAETKNNPKLSNFIPHRSNLQPWICKR
jgi:hypothetical protein